MDAANEKTDLVLERTVDVSPELVWKAWTTPKHLMQWFCPKPWQTVECEIDLRPGGRFVTVMQSPDGERMPANAGCYLEVVPNRKLVWTSALAPGWRPQDAGDAPFVFTCILALEPHGSGGCRYTATAMHTNEKGAKAHAEMGFHQGWGTSLDQLVAYMKEQGAT